jgi:hypothetical protein
MVINDMSFHFKGNPIEITQNYKYFLRGLRFPPTYITNCPILFIYRANNVLVDAQLSIQYFNILTINILG